MLEDLAAQIESWFRQHDDGEFAILTPDRLERQGEVESADTIVYTTKPACVSRMQSAALGSAIAIAGGYGLPDAAALETLPKRAEWLFVGDADPPDLLIFAWLRTHHPIQWRGVCDAMLPANRSAITIALSPSERAAVPLLNSLCPDYREQIGPRCAALLIEGLKIELEGALATRPGE